jgi:hypothetical protein
MHGHKSTFVEFDHQTCGLRERVEHALDGIHDCVAHLNYRARHNYSEICGGLIREVTSNMHLAAYFSENSQNLRPVQGSGGSTYYFMCSFIVTRSYVCKEIVRPFTMHRFLACYPR